MDAAINTLEIKMKESGTANFDQLKNEVLQVTLAWPILQ